MNVGKTIVNIGKIIVNIGKAIARNTHPCENGKLRTSARPSMKHCEHYETGWEEISPHKEREHPDKGKE